MSDAGARPEGDRAGDPVAGGPGRRESLLERRARRRAQLAKGSGPIAWMARNPVAANLVMVLLVLGGLMMLPGIKQEVFPEFDLDLVAIQIAYPGASPAEVEQAVILAAEEAVRGLEGIKEVRSRASEGGALVTVELLTGADPDRALADIKSAIDRVTSFPEDIERPVTSLATNRMEVISLVLSGDVPEKALRALGEKTREELLLEPNITQVELTGVRPPEVSIEVPRAQLRRYGLTLESVAAAVRAASVELPGGGVKTAGGEVLVRTTERRRTAADFRDIVVLGRPDGTAVHLGDIAAVRDEFRDTDQAAFFNGQRAVMVDVYRVGAQTPLDVAATVKRYAQEHAEQLPPGVSIGIWADRSQWYAERLDLLLRNAGLGLVMVMGILALFLELRLAFWVTMGIPISFLGSLLFLPQLGASINMISLFAFIVTLGMVVDDAIVVGESIYTQRQLKKPGVDAAVLGAGEVGTPVTFAILTTVVAFAPMLFVPGPLGKFFRLIPVVVIAVLLISLMESLFVLPAHLAHLAERPPRLLRLVDERQQRFSRWFEELIERAYRPVVRAVVRWRYLTVAAAIASLLLTLGLIVGGRVEFTFMPKIEGDLVLATLELPYGAPVAETQKLVDRLTRSAQEILEESGGQREVSLGIFAQVGQNGSLAGGDRARGLGPSGSHLAEVIVSLVPVSERSFSAKRFASQWRERVGEQAGVDSLRFIYDVTGPNAGAPVHIELRHADLGTLEAAAAELSGQLRAYAGVFDIDDGFSPGKEQLDFRLKPAARALGVTEVDLGRQLRSAFYGAEAVREQRGRDELRVYVRLPEAERKSEHDIEQFLIQTPGGGEVPLRQAAEVDRGRSYTEISRRDGRRVVNVTADLDPAVTTAGKVLTDAEAQLLPPLLAKHRGLTYSLEGEQASQREVFASLGRGMAFAIAVMFGLLAVAFRSYTHPLVVMGVIPFGLVGAVLGHVLMGYNLSMMSAMGLVALSGVVVNDSLILVVAVNELRERGERLEEAVVSGSVRRFRPILLTSLTTFCGLMPMILETSTQARFLIPMAISLGFGVLFATAICLAVVPASYAVLVDLERLFRGGIRGPVATAPARQG